MPAQSDLAYRAVLDTSEGVILSFVHPQHADTVEFITLVPKDTLDQEDEEVAINTMVSELGQGLATGTYSRVWSLTVRGPLVPALTAESWRMLFDYFADISQLVVDCWDECPYNLFLALKPQGSEYSAPLQRLDDLRILARWSDRMEKQLNEALDGRRDHAGIAHILLNLTELPRSYSLAQARDPKEVERHRRRLHDSGGAIQISLWPANEQYLTARRGQLEGFVII